MYVCLYTTAPTVTSPLSLHDALPISRRRRLAQLGLEVEVAEDAVEDRERRADVDHVVEQLADRPEEPRLQRREGDDRDRKSTRLNSSHVEISYAVFCLKKKK